MLMLVLAALTFAADPAPDAVMQALEAEVDATMDAWKGEEDAPYFLGYRVVETRTSSIGAAAGTLDRLPRVEHRRRIDVMARVGDYNVDSTRKLRDASNGWGGYQGDALPVDDDIGVLRHAIWAQTEEAVQQARERITQVRTNRRVKVKDQEETPDFSKEAVVVDVGSRAELDLDLMPWAPVLTELSLLLADEPLVIWHDLTVMAYASDEWIVTSEGTRIRQPTARLRLSVSGMVTADDGMDLRLYRWKDVDNPASLPKGDELARWVTSLRSDLLALREAPRGDPWSGPVLMRGRAAGVFVHEVIGHRAEGHRQEDANEGQTFKALVGKRVTAPSISIIDDPTIDRYAGQDLNGHYAYDQEGVAAQRAVLVEDGVLRGFLMGRDPIPGFAKSNGHGRAMVGRAPVARMANTIVQTSDPKTEAQLRKMLLAEAKRRKAPYALMVDELDGGFTLTGRVFPNTFNIRAVTAWRVYVDGRDDELVRGVDLVGTPLEALRSIVAAGSDPGVFNGYCGAESGSIPNAAVSPSLLLRSLEIQKKETDLDRPPLLPKPGIPKGDS